ncbi:bifunctional phosphoglucose/phosphomannose isomerase [Infirmifilum sp.]|uniref:bifunctional phosphoglucose/phosphomannose isomerase n=1 Tax=Infirmifilum sp. TaxID=2856575 RepID=UPI003D1321C9
MGAGISIDDIYSLVSPKAKLLDSSGMLIHALSMPKYLSESIVRYKEDVSKLTLPDPSTFDGVVISGMGGSFISGLFLQDLASDRSSKAIILNRDVRLPRFIDEKKLLVAVSYSGNTEETLRIYLEGLRRNIPVVAVTSGGELAAVSEKLGKPVIRLPPGIPPRAAFPHLTAAIAALTSSVLGLDLLGELRRAIDELAKREDSVLSDGLALSRLLFSDVQNNLTPLIYGYSPYLSPAYRFKTQINENSKIHAFFGELPEANHNEIMGWNGVLKSFTVVFVRGREEPKYMEARIEFLENLFDKNNIRFYNLHGNCETRACELLSLIMKADVASIALALLLGVDPTPVDTITQLKKFLDSKIGFSLHREIN